MDIINRIIEANQAERFNIYIIGDVHTGSNLFDEDNFKKTIKTIKNDDNGYWIGLGDCIEGISYNDPRFQPKSVSREYGIREMSDIFRHEIQHYYSLVKDITSKCLVRLYGNHEETIIKHSNYNPIWTYEHLAEQPEITIGYTGYMNLYFKLSTTSKIKYTFFLNHGTGGGGKEPGYADRKAYKVGRWRDTDFSIMGHIHQNGYVRQPYYRLNKNEIIKHYRHYIANPCYLKESNKGDRGYYEANSDAPPSSIGYTKISFSLADNKKDSEVKVNQILFE